MKFRIRIAPEYFYYYLLVVLLVNNWWGDLRVFQEIYLMAKPLVLGSAFIFLVGLIIKEKYSFIELASAFLLILCGIYTAYITGSKWTLYSMILIAFARKIDIERTIKIVYYCMSLFLIISVGIFLLQYIFRLSTLIVSEDGLKYNMTFVGANEAARYWIFWFALFLYVNAEQKILLYKKVIIFFITLFFYYFTRSDALVMILAMALLRYFEKWKPLNKIIEKFAGYSFGIMWAFSIVMLKLEDTRLFNVLNNFATGRFRLGKRGLEMYGPSVLGQAGLEFFNWINSDVHGSYRLVIDNAFYMIMIQYGVFYLILITYLFIKARKRIDYKTACCLISYSVFSLAENVILSPTAIFPVIIAANMSWKPNVNEDIQNENWGAESKRSRGKKE